VPVVESDGEFLRVAMAAIVKARELLRWTWVYSYYKTTPDLIFDDQQVCIHAYIHTFLFVCMNVCMFLFMYVYVCMHVCIYAYTYMYLLYVCPRIYVYTYTWMYVCMYVWMYVCIYVHIFVCMYMCIYASMCCQHSWFCVDTFVIAIYATILIFPDTIGFLLWKSVQDASSSRAGVQRFESPPQDFTLCAKCWQGTLLLQWTCELYFFSLSNCKYVNLWLIFFLQFARNVTDALSQQDDI
jgi:hypothetical protein